MVALGALSVSIVVGQAATCARVVAVAIYIAMYRSKVHGCWAAAGCFSVWPSQQSCSLKRLGISY